MDLRISGYLSELYFLILFLLYRVLVVQILVFIACGSRKEVILVYEYMMRIIWRTHCIGTYNINSGHSFLTHHHKLLVIGTSLVIIEVKV